jgi:hypothetical protein
MIPKNLIMKDLIWLLDLQFSGSDEDTQTNSNFFNEIGIERSWATISYIML